MKFWKPMLAKKLEPYLDKLDYPIGVQAKLDGVRCVLTDDGFYSRNEKKIKGMPLLEQDAMQYKDLCLDGELFSKYMGFQSILSSVRKTVNIDENKQIGYYVFDANVPGNFKARHAMLQSNIIKYTTEGKLSRICVLPYNIVNKAEELFQYYAYYIDHGYEGIIVRDLNTPYQCKRTKALLKMKPNNTMEVKVIDMIRGTGKYIEVMGAMLCKTESGMTVSVGSGFNDAQRTKYWYDQNNIKGKNITIKYQELTDLHIPRFPVFVAIRDYE